MRALVQRVRTASVTINDVCRAKIGQGLLILLGVTHDDGAAQAELLAKKCADLRVFEDEQGKMNRAVGEIGGEILVVSQFTLYADCRKGNRPAFIAAARPETAQPLYEDFTDRLRQRGIPVQTGEFGADMKVELLNDGPVTILLDTDELKRKG
ncbi:MAG: D-aminoacyl-tRNA deacylase [Clostridia bacterium]|nr:D-aminoacyl-tRNA deacylase [Clostridia bacterium]